ncbi:MAG: hypothetical protein DI535_04425 [Citrobacter freundii]|nr:MAG: hypothetical protein DI535_04425 [Citrobacter freundii]
MKRYIGFLAIAGILGLSSCVKEDPPLGSKGTTNVIEFYNQVPDLISSLITSTHPSYNIDLVFTGDTQPVDIVVSYSGAETAAPQDITVNVAIDPTMIPTFNTQNATSLVAMDATVFQADTWTVTIPKGQKQATIHGKVLKATYDFGKSYGLPLKITSASFGKVSTNYGTMIFRIQARNGYDGVYKIISGNVQRYSAPGVPTSGDALNGSLAGNPNLSLVTVDATTVELQNMTWHGGTSGIGGINNTRAKVDPTTNLVTMSSVGNTTLANTLGKDNKYDPATKTYTINFNWNPATTPREVSYVLQYVGPR